jgi:nucleoside-diphosphate-sugar epimerase
VRTVTLSREAEENAGTFGRKIRELRPDIVIDMICFTEASARHLVDALRGQVRHFLHTGTIWVHGPGVEVPTTEMQPRRPFGEYGIAKAQIEAYLVEMARKDSFPATIIHPGHIVGLGWEPLNPAGHFNPSVFTMLAKGEELSLPNFGLETVHHVHADDVAQMFMSAITHWSASVGEAFHAVSPAAITLRGYAEARRRGSAASRSCDICLGRNGRVGKTNWRQSRLTITSPAAPIAASPKRSACSAIAPAIGRSRRCVNR